MQITVWQNWESDRPKRTKGKETKHSFESKFEAMNACVQGPGPTFPLFSPYFAWLVAKASQTLRTSCYMPIFAQSQRYLHWHSCLRDVRLQMNWHTEFMFSLPFTVAVPFTSLWALRSWNTLFLLPLTCYFTCYLPPPCFPTITGSPSHFPWITVWRSPGHWDFPVTGLALQKNKNQNIKLKQKLEQQARISHPRWIQRLGVLACDQ